MADKTYVKVASVGVKDAFDSKYKSTLPKLMREKIEKAINNSSKLTTRPPANKDAEGFSMDGGLSLKKTSKGVEGEMKIALSTWPKEAIFGTASSKASVDVSNPAEVDGAVQDVVNAIMDDVKTKVIKEFEKRAKC